MLSMSIAQKPIFKELEKDNHFLRLKLTEKEKKISELEEQLNWFKKQLFGKRSEREVSEINPEQLMFEGFEVLLENLPDKKKVKEHERKSPSKKGEDKIVLPKDLPVEKIVLDLPEKEKICQENGKPLVKIGEEVTHKLAYKPGSFYVKEIIRPKYAHPMHEEKGIYIREMPDTLLPKSRADESFLSLVLVKKFCDHLPLYRISEGLTRCQIQISRKLLSKWVILCGKALLPLYEEMKKEVLKGKSLFIDETPIKLQNKKKCKTAYMWVLAGEDISPYRVYHFTTNRAHEHAEALLCTYKGVVHSDKYGAYQKLAEKKTIKWMPCFAHIRRKFYEAETGDPLFRKYVLRKIKHLFMLEKIALSRNKKERNQIRKEKELPILEEMTETIKKKFLQGKVLPKSKLGQAIRYYMGLLPYLKTYIDHPEAKIDNNTAERAIRPLAIGRKNWLFFGSSSGGQAGAVILSLVQTCRGLGINPEEYLENVMRRIMGHSMKKLKELLPDQWKKAQDQLLTPAKSSN